MNSTALRPLFPRLRRASRVLFGFLSACLLFTGAVRAQTFTNNIVDFGDGSSNVLSTLTIGPDGKIYCLWMDGGPLGSPPLTGNTGTYKIIRWNTTNSAWDSISSFPYTQVGGVDVAFSIGSDTPLQIDSSGGYHFAFTVPNASPLGNAVYYAYSATGASWAFTQLINLTATNDSPGTVLLTLDQNQRPHVFFLESNIGTGSGPPWTSRVWTVWHYSFNGSTWSHEAAYSQNGGSGSSPNELNNYDVAMDSLGKAHIVVGYENDGTSLDGNVGYTTNAGGSWSALQVLATGASGSAAGSGTVITVDSNDKVHIVRRNSAFQVFYHTNKTGAFVSGQINGDLLGNPRGTFRGLTTNTLGDVVLVYNGQSQTAGGNPGTVKYAALFAGQSTWQLGDIFTGGTNTGRFISASLTDSRLLMTTFDHFTNPAGAVPPPNPSPRNSGPYNSRQLQYAFATISPPSSAPTVTTATQASVTATTATLGGNVTSDGGASVTDRGIVWATISNPTTSNTKVANGTGTGAFSATVTGLTSSSTIHVRAYAINASGTSYGSDISFSTPSSDTTKPTVVSIVRLTPGTQPLTTATTSVVFRVTYSEAVTGVAAGNFQLENFNGGTLTGSVTGVSTSSSSVYDVTVSLTGGSGQFRLKVVN